MVNPYSAGTRTLQESAKLRLAHQRINVQPKAARVNCREFRSPSRSAWRLQRGGPQVPASLSHELHRYLLRWQVLFSQFQQRREIIRFRDNDRKNQIET